MTVKLDPEAALPKSETKQDIWQSDKRGKQLAKVTVRVKVDGDEYETTLGKCPFAFAPREEFYLPFYGANKSNTKRMKDTMQRLYDRIKTAIKTQSFDGEIGLLPCRIKRHAEIQGLWQHAWSLIECPDCFCRHGCLD